MKLSGLPKGTLKSSDLLTLCKHLAANDNWRHCVSALPSRERGTHKFKDPRVPISTLQGLGVPIIHILRRPLLMLITIGSGSSNWRSTS